MAENLCGGLIREGEVADRERRRGRGAGIDEQDALAPGEIQRMLDLELIVLQGRNA
jgi:hypothetical protein